MKTLKTLFCKLFTMKLYKDAVLNIFSTTLSNLTKKFQEMSLHGALRAVILMPTKSLNTVQFRIMMST